MPDVPYAFHTSPFVPQQLQHLQACLDPITTDALDQLGVGAGWRCLEVGAGGGSIAGWLQARVGSGGEVTATDLDVSHVPVVDGMRVLRHDLTRHALPTAQGGRGWDLIHARLVLQHLPQRRQLVTTLARGLAPGGWLLLEDFDCRHLPVASAASHADAELFGRVTFAVLTVLEQAGADLGWGVDSYDAMRGAGLVEVASHIRSQTWPGGSPGCLLHATNTLQLAGALREMGLDEAALERFRALMQEPDFAAPFYLMVSTRGRARGAAG